MANNSSEKKKVRRKGKTYVDSFLLHFVLTCHKKSRRRCKIPEPYFDPVLLHLILFSHRTSRKRCSSSEPFFDPLFTCSCSSLCLVQAVIVIVLSFYLRHGGARPVQTSKPALHPFLSYVSFVWLHVHCCNRTRAMGLREKQVILWAVAESSQQSEELLVQYPESESSHGLG